ncbi:MAG TPA: signal peptidase I [Candidatus Limnocylindrales bacterium]|jgi:signal peptidase I
MGLARIDIARREDRPRLPRLAFVTEPQASPDPTAGTSAGARRWLGGALFEVVETIVLTVVIFFGIQAFVAQPFQVMQTSMEQTLEPDQYVLVDKLTPRWSAYQPGDIVVFDPPAGATAQSGIPLIKRVIAVGGDRVALRDGAVYVNDRQLSEPYIYSDEGVSQPTEPRGPVSSWVVPAGDLFVMGDHREVSDDSRVFGPIAATSVVGRAFLRYWPFDTFEVISRP